MTDQPLIYTSKGNVPADTLDYHTEWTVQPDFIKFREFYTDKATGEVVKDSTHGYMPQGIASAAVAASF